VNKGFKSSLLHPVLTGLLTGSGINVEKGKVYILCTYAVYSILTKYFGKRAENAELCNVISYSYKIVSREVV
jgi:hypothetical protein